MKPERWRSIEGLFHRAVALGAAERAALLDLECAADGELRAEVERLIERDESGSDAFSRLEAHTLSKLQDPMLGQSLGAYRLIERIAAGGMGVVYRAERSDGLFQQEVAIKLIRAERASEWMLRRFEFERRTLAGLQHPGIARLFDGGTTNDGCPYFVMELVRGETIDHYCARERLPIAARLRLFVQVCRAVQFAHQNLVVHCDLKPANILIDERGLPRLLDFGIARLLEDEPQAASPAAPGTIARVLTPEYASPEQLAGSAVTTSIDVYSLGVVLYELLTGRRPFQSKSRTAADWENLIREKAPERPSTSMLHATAGTDDPSLAAGLRGTRASLRRALRGDLDRIVLMALRKEPQRRYPSVQAFADDIERQLTGQPVHARDNSVFYLGTKFVRRNRVAVAATFVVFAALLVGLVAARRSEKIAEAEALHAGMEADSFQSIADFLMDAFLPVQASQDQAWQERARERILAHADRVRRQYIGNDHVRANLLDTLGQVCLRLDLAGDGEVLLREALTIREEVFGAQSLEYALSLRSLGQFFYQAGDYSQAAQLLSVALQIQRAQSSSTHANVAGLANDLAACLRNLGREAEAEALHLEALQLRRQSGDDTLPVAESLNNLAGVHIVRGEFALAVEELREALALRESILGPQHALSLQTLSNLASALWRQGEHAQASQLMQRAEAGYRALGGDGEDGLALSLANHATMQLANKELDGAAADLDEALELQTRRLGADHPLLAGTLTNLALLNHARHRDDEAGEAWEQVLRIRRAERANPRELAEALFGYGVFRCELGEFSTAITLIEESIELQRSSAQIDSLALGRAEFQLGVCLLRSGARDQARRHWNEAARLLDESPQATAPERANVRQRLEELGLK